MKSILTLLTISVFCSPLFVAAQSSSGNDIQQTTDTIIQEIPIKERLEQAPQEMHELFSQNPFRLPESQNKSLLDDFEQAFHTDSLLHDFREIFPEKYDEKHAARALEWLQKESTQKVLKAEEDSYSLQGIREQIVRDYEFEQDPPAEERRELVQQLIRNRSEAESDVESDMIIFRGLLSAINERNGGQIEDMQMQGIIGNFQSRLQSEVNQDLSKQYLVMYYELDDHTLQDYASFFDTDAGNWLHAAVSKSIHAAYQKAAERLQN